METFVHISQVHLCWHICIFSYWRVSSFQKYIPKLLTEQPWCLWEQKGLSFDVNSELFQQSWTPGKKKSLNSLNTIPGNLERPVVNCLMQWCVLFLLLHFSCIISVFNDFSSVESRYLGPFIWGKLIKHQIPQNLCSRTFKRTQRIKLPVQSFQLLVMS